jgi:hypothetical protein
VELLGDAVASSGRGSDGRVIGLGSTGSGAAEASRARLSSTLSARCCESGGLEESLSGEEVVGGDGSDADGDEEGLEHLSDR